MDIEAQAKEMDHRDSLRFRRVCQTARSIYGQELVNVTCPGGSHRCSYRIHLTDRSLIATCRDSEFRTRLEAYILHRLQNLCDDLPRCVGILNDVLFQSDVGTKRLAVEMACAGQARQEELAASAVQALFRIHRAGRDADLHRELPHLGANDIWLQHFVKSVRRLEKLGASIARNFDRFSVMQALSIQPKQFVKWDCRSGNAALNENDHLRWFDLEYAGVRHGAEDFSWLIADETWPILPERMLAIIDDAFDSTISKEKRESWIEYLSIYTVFHAAERLRLVQDEVKKRGWKSKEKILGHDDVGMHPSYARKLCSVGAFFSERSPLTAPLTKAFETVGKHYGDDC
jgi:hypothetical protein